MQILCKCYKRIFFIDTRRKAKKGYPIKLQIYCSLTQQRKYIHTKRYQQSKSRRTAEAQQELSKLLNRLEPLRDLELQEALPLLQKEGDLEVLAMKVKLEKIIPFVDFYEFTRGLIKEKKLQGMDTKAFEAAIREVKGFMDNKPFGLNDITYSWVQKYKLFKIERGTGNGGISYYLRTLRTIHNEGIKRDMGVMDIKPFTGLITNSPSPEHLRKNWDLEDIRALLRFRHPNATKATRENMQRVIDIFMFQIAIGGHDLIDVANLKWSNIKKIGLSFRGIRIETNPMVEDGSITC